MDFSLRPWQADDAASLLQYAASPRVAANLRDTFPHPYTAADAAWFLDDCAKADDTRDCRRAIVVDGRAVGGITLVRLDDVYSKTMEIGYWLGEPFWGQGIMTAAVRQVCAMAFARGDVERIQAAIFARNAASQRVLQKAGFALEGVLRRSVYKNGELMDSCMYALLKP